MSNMIRLNAAESKENRFSMSNQGTDTFLELIILAASNLDATASQKRLIDYLAERMEVNRIAPGTASFDVIEMPWNKDTLQEDVSFMIRALADAEEPGVFGRLDYRPDMRVVTPWLRLFAQMIYNLDKEYIYGPEEEAIVRSGIGAIYGVLRGEDGKAKKRLLFFLDWYLDPYYENDPGSLYEPLKEMLQDAVITGNEADVIGEALHLLEAYMEPPFDVLEENLQRVPAQFLARVEDLINAGAAENCLIELTGSRKERIDQAIQLAYTEVSEEEIAHFCDIYQEANIPLLPSALAFYKQYGGVFRNHYLELDEPGYNQDVIWCFYADLDSYTGLKRNARIYLEFAMNGIDEVQAFAKQKVCPVGEFGFYYPAVVYIGEDGLLYCVFEYKEEMEIHKEPSTLFEKQLGKNDPVGLGTQG